MSCLRILALFFTAAGMAWGQVPPSINLTSAPNPSTPGQTVTLTAQTQGIGPDRTITFRDLTTNTTLGSGVTGSTGVATFQISTLSVGSHNLQAVFQLPATVSGNPVLSNTVVQVVGKLNPTVTVTSQPKPSVFGQSVTITAQVSPASASGTVTFADGNTTLGTVNLNNGAATITTSALAVGSHTLTATYNGDSSFNSATGQTSQTVNLAPSTTTLSTVNPNPAAVGATVTLIASVTPTGATGTVTFFDGTTQLGAPVNVNNGSAGITISTFTAGTHSLTAAYSGDTNRAPSTSSPVTLTVTQTTTLTLAANPTTATFGQSVTLTATANPSSTSGTVTFLDGGSQIGTGTLSNGTATFSTSSLTVGSHTLTATLPGGVTSNQVTVVVNKANSTTSLVANPTTATSGQAVTLTATVVPAANATGTVTFLDGTNPIATVAVTNGTATTSTSSLSVGGHSLTASYSGNATLNPSTSSPVNVTVGPAVTATQTSLSATPNPANVGQTVTLSALVTPSGATGTVTFRDGTNSIGTAALVNGSATIQTTFTTAGNHSITASYGGDNSFSASTSAPVTLVINSPINPTTTTLSVSPNPASVGQPITLSAVVSPATATGTVTFRDGTTSIGTTGVVNGTATVVTPSLAAGNHSITATYNGDTNNSSSTSAPVLEVVNPSGATVTLSASPTTANFGQTVTLTVVVNPGTATGTVTIFDSVTAAPVGSTTTLSNGTATITTNTLSVGTHSLQAFYSGDPNNGSAQSNFVTVTINLTPSTITLTGPTSAAVGQSVTLTATVAPAGATGTVNFRDGNTSIGTSTLNSAGIATLATSTLAAGTHTITAIYAGDANFGSSTSAPVTITVGTVPCVPFPSGFVPFTSVAYVSQPNSAGDRLLVGGMSAANFATYQNLPLPTAPNQQFCGTVFLADGTPVVAYVPTSAERAGDFSPFSGLLINPANNQPFPGGVIPAALIPGTFAARIVAALQNSTTRLSVSPATSAPGQPVTLTAAVTPTSATGTVTFADGASTLGSAALSGGTATLTLSTLAAGTHSIIATYSGDAANGPSTSNAVTVTVGVPPPQITGPAALPPGVVNAPYSQTFTATGSGTLTWSLTSGSVPGLTLSAAGVLSGTPTAAGNFPLTVRVQDGSGQSATGNFSLTVNATLSINVITLPPGFVGGAYSQTFTATGGSGTLTWTLAAGAVPGLNLSAGGVLSGTPTSAGNFQLTVRVVDATGQVTAGVFPLTVNPAVPPINLTVTQPSVITDSPAPQMTLGQGYPLALSATYRLTFTPNAAGLPTPFNNTAVQFVTGGTTATVAIPPNSTAAVTLPGVQLGTVAGTITVQLASLTAAGQAVPLPATVPSVTITVPRLAPVIVPGSVRITAVTATSFQVFLDASSTPRDLTSAAFTFTAASGTQLNGTSFTVSLTSTAASWFVATNNDATANGGAFSLTFPFTYSGDTSALNTVSVTLTNSVGTSAPVSGGKS